MSPLGLHWSSIWQFGGLVCLFYTAWTPIRGLYFAGEQEGWTVRGLEGDFCSVLVAVSGGAGEHPWCSSVTGSIQLDRYVPNFSLFHPFASGKLGFGAVVN